MNRSIFSVLFMVLVVTAAVGFYRGWFTFSTREVETGSRKVNVNLTVDPDKIKEDAEAVKVRAAELTDKIKETTTEPGSPKHNDPVKSLER